MKTPQIVPETLAEFPFFGILNQSDLEWILHQATAENCQPGRVLIQEGHPVESLYLSLSGTLAVTVSRQDGGEQELKRLFAGELMGEMSFLDNHLPSATIKVVEDSQVLSLSKNTLARKLEIDGDFASRFYHLLSLKLSDQLRGLSGLLTENQALPSEPLRKVLLVFAVLNDSDIAWMIANGVPEKVIPDTILIQQGKPVPAVYILLEGTLGIYISLTKNGITTEKEVAKSIKGEILGEMSFVEIGTASATVKVVENAWLLALPQSQLAAKLEADRPFASRFYRAIAVVLSNRWRDRLMRRGFATLANDLTSMLSEEIDAEDELDFDVLEGTAIAGTRFDWMIRQLR